MVFGIVHVHDCYTYILMEDLVEQELLQVLLVSSNIEFCHWKVAVVTFGFGFPSHDKKFVESDKKKQIAKYVQKC